jgi:cell division protein FtsL
VIQDRRPRRLPRPQRLHRERDPRIGRSVGLVLLAAGLAVVLGLGVVALRVHQVHLAYRLEALREERARTEHLIRELRVEVATLAAPARLEARARALGLQAPAPEQVRLAREYVPAAADTVAARLAGAGALVR